MQVTMRERRRKAPAVQGAENFRPAELGPFGFPLLPLRGGGNFGT